MIVPIMIVQTIWDELKYGARSLLAPSSTAMTDIPAKNSVRYRNALFFNILFSLILFFLFYYSMDLSDSAISIASSFLLIIISTITKNINTVITPMI